MKESRLIQMSNQIETLGQVVNKLIHEMENLKNLSVGTLETVKRLPGYEDAISELAKSYGEKEDTSGAATGDSGSLITDE